MKNNHNLKKSKLTFTSFTKYRMIIIALIFTIMAVGQSVWGANRFSIAVGNWNSTNTWAATSGGAAGASVPIAGDVVYIQNGKSVTVTEDAAASSITFTGAAATLTINSGFTLSVSGTVILLHNVGASTSCLITGGGTLSCASVDAGSNLSLNGDFSAIMTSTIFSFNISGDVTMIAKESGANYGQSGFRVEDGTTTVGGQITSSLGVGCVGAFRMNGLTTGLQTGTLVLNGATPWGTLTSITLTLNGTSATVKYNGASSQAIRYTTYTNLEINSGGTATLTGSTTVNGVLTMTKGIFSLGGFTLTYGSTASLNYNGILSQTTGAEWPTTFVNNVTITNNSTNGVSLNANKTYNTGGVLTVNGHLNFSTYYIAGTGAFTLSSGGTITSAYVTNGEGFGLSGNNSAGSIRVSGSRTLSSGANYILNGSGTAQNTGTNMPASVNNLTLNNATGITLSQSTTVNGTLSLTNGLLNTGSNTITLGASASISNASSTSYVNGKLARIYSSVGSKDFTIGKGGNYRPFSLNYTELSGTSTVVAEQFESTIPGSVPVYTSLFTSRYWAISESGSSSRTYKLSIDGSGYSPTHEVKMIKGDGTTNVSYDVTSPNYTNVNGFTSFSNFGLGESQSTTTTANSTNATYGATSVDLIANVSPTPTGGTVQFSIDGNSVGAAVNLISGSATLNYNPHLLNVGGHTISATYSGYNIYQPSNTITSGTLTIDKAPLSVTADNVSKTFDGFIYSLPYTVTYSGFVNGQDASSLAGALEFSGTAIAATAVGNYTISPAGLISSNYSFTYHDGSLAIDQATSVVWNGSASSDWNTPSNWTPPVAPISGISATIQSASNAALISSTGNVCNNLTINSGSLTIAHNGTLSVEGTLANNAGTTALIIKSNVNGNGSLIEHTSGVNASVEQYITQASGVKYHYISSPISNASTHMFWGYYMYRLNEVAGLWVSMIDNQPLIPMMGYAIYKQALQNTNETKTFSGILHTGTYEISCSKTNNSLFPGWNLVGNPYPSAIDIDAAAGFVRTNIDEAIYTYNQTTGLYGYYLSGAGINGSQFIAPNQGFMVRVSSDGVGSLRLTNDARVHNAQAFLKNAPVNLLRLTATADNFSDETLIRFNDESTNGFDAKFDAYKLMSEKSSAQLYSVSGSENLSINTLPKTDDAMVSLHLKINQDGEYKILASELNSFDAATFIYLEDLRLNTLTDLRETPEYNFSASTKDETARFRVLFSLTPKKLGCNGETCKNAKIYSYEKNIFVNTPQNAIGTIEVCDVAGKQVFTAKLKNNTLNSFSLNHLVSGFYMVKLYNAGEVISEKLLIK